MHRIISGLIWFIGLLCFIPLVLQGQSRYSLRVTFTDKQGTPYHTSRPQEFLSEKAIQRRTRQHIAINQDDLPVSPVYLDSLKALGYAYRNPSKWFNSVLVDIDYPHQVKQLSDLGFVVDAAMVAERPSALSTSDKFKVDAPLLKSLHLADSGNYGYAYGQIHLHNGEYLHNSGYKGRDMTIAVIDAGFYKVDALPAFQHLWQNGKIMGWYDFVGDEFNFFATHTHGMHVLSIIGGKMEKSFLGTAPEANYWLLRSEDVYSEMLVEEDNWVRAAEFADSAGVDIINTSLGYSLFDYEYMNHQYEDMDGKTTRISQAAARAATKGMILVISAGNEGNDPWYYITAPADADSIITVGAVNANGEIASFSSHGPTPDGRIKPTVVATGWNTYIQYSDGAIGPGNGTSFSAPVISGLTACLWQAYPDASNYEIIAAIKESADMYGNPDENFGFGIPDFQMAFQYLQFNQKDSPTHLISLKSDPATGIPGITLQSGNPIGNYHINIYTLSGQLIWTFNASNENLVEHISLNILEKYKPGIYLIHVQTSTTEKTFKIFR